MDSFVGIGGQMVFFWQSFSAPENPHDNAVAESFFANKEEAYRRNYTSARSFIDDVANYIEFFNNFPKNRT